MNLFDGNAAHENDNDDLKKIKTYLNKYPKIRELINELYRKNTIYLDKNFDTAIKADPYAKLWELYTLYMLKQHSVSIEPKRKKSPAPDFCINHFMDGKRLYIECVCPNIAQEGLELSGGDFTSKMDPVEEMRQDDKEGCWFVKTDNDKFLLRITGALESKSKKFEEYIFGKDKSVEIDSYKVLLINGYRLCERTAEKKFSLEFIDYAKVANHGIWTPAYCVDTKSECILQQERVMEKNENSEGKRTPIIAKINPDYIRHFDAIGTRYSRPFEGDERITLFPIKENSTKFYEELKKLLTCPYLP